MVTSLEGHSLGKTAQYIAACRAVESAKPPQTRKFFEPWAQNFATEASTELMRSVAKVCAVSVQDLVGIITARTCFVDDVVKRGVAKHSPRVRQVVIAAVGGDGRPYRLPFPDDVVVFEMDLPDVMKYRTHVFRKQLRVQPLCELRSIEADLSKHGWEDALLAAGFNPSDPSLWITEGLLMYMTNEECDQFISKIATLCTPGSVLCGDNINEGSIRFPGLAGFRKVWADVGAASFLSGVDDPKEFFGEHGFQTTVKFYPELAAEFGLPYSSGGSIQPEEGNNEPVPPMSYLFEATMRER